MFVFPFSLVLGFVWGGVGYARGAGAWEGLGAPFAVCGVCPFPFPFFVKNIFLGRVLGVRFGVGLVVDAFPMGGEKVPGGWVPGGATFFGAVRVPGCVWGLGVVGSVG